MSIKISVIVPVYNAERYIYKCLKSICTQTLRELEIILVDDGSIDSSGVICDNYAKQDERIQVIHQENKGVSEARNCGIEKAHGEFVTFVDADDWIDVDAYEIFYNNMVVEQADILIYQYVKRFDGIKKDIVPTKVKEEKINGIEAIDRVNFNHLSAGPCDKIWRLTLIKDIKFPVDVTIGEDYTFVIHALEQAETVLISPCIKYNYFQHADSVSYKGFNKKSKNVLENYKKVKKEIIEKYPSLSKGAIAYCILQEMAVVISMIKANHYEKDIIRIITKDVRKAFWRYVTIGKVPIYLKCSAGLLSIHYYFLCIPYEMFFKKKREV